MYIASDNGGKATSVVTSGPAEFLRARPRGVYTVMRVLAPSAAREPIAVSQLRFHLARLATSTRSPDDAADAARVAADDLRAPVVAAAEACVHTWVRSAMLRTPQAPTARHVLMVTVLVLRGGGAGCTSGGALRVHCMAMPTVGTSSCVALCRGHRRAPRAKHSSWLDARLPLEAQKRDGVGEVVMVRGDGAALEGLVSNLFVVRRGVLFTARGDVLHGSARELVIEACAAAVPPVEVCFVAPRALGGGDLAAAAGVGTGAPEAEARDAPRSVREWDEAFLTSVVKLVQPVVEVRSRGGFGLDGGTAAADGEAVAASHRLAVGPITQALAACVRSRLGEFATPRPAVAAAGGVGGEVAAVSVGAGAEAADDST
jgi:branched-subunit amino acid aminotransferase/4-amino-4-deoxychorismate lyase